MVKKLEIALGILALTFLISPAGQVLNVSGQWNSSIGAVYNIQQNGNQYTWTAPSLNQSGTGTISGNSVTMSGPGWTVKGTITESDQAGNATKIEGENGVVLFRTIGGPTAPTTAPAQQTAPSTPQAPPGQPLSISGQWNSSIGAVYNIQQSGNQYNWSAPSLNQSGTGTISGKAVTISGPGWTVKGTVTESDQAGNATKIVGENGVVLFRTMGGQVPYKLQKPPRVWSPSRTKNQYYRLAPGEKINLNTASEFMLVALPGIGKGRAAAIIKSRPYTRIEDLMKVKGIKHGTFERLKDLIKV